jgi:hypothetical protein
VVVGQVWGAVAAPRRRGAPEQLDLRAQAVERLFDLGWDPLSLAPPDDRLLEGEQVSKALPHGLARRTSLGGPFS